MSTVNLEWDGYRYLGQGTLTLIGGTTESRSREFLQNAFIRKCVFTEPPPVEPTDKIPTIVYTTPKAYTNADAVNLMIKAKEAATGQNLDLNQIDTAKELAASLTAAENRNGVNPISVTIGYLMTTGWNVILHQYNPTAMTQGDLWTLVDNYETEGYDIRAIYFDQVNHLIDHEDELFDQVGLTRELRTEAVTRKISFVGGMAVPPPDDAVDDHLTVDNLAGWGGFPTLSPELDLEVFVDVTQDDTGRYLDVLIGKARSLDIPKNRRSRFRLTQ